MSFDSSRKKQEQAAPDRLVREGERVGSLEVIATPGHCSFLDTRDRTIIAGDAFQTMGGVAVSGTFKPLFPLVYYATWHKGLALTSVRKLYAFQPICAKPTCRCQFVRCAALPLTRLSGRRRVPVPFAIFSKTQLTREPGKELASTFLCEVEGLMSLQGFDQRGKKRDKAVYLMEGVLVYRSRGWIVLDN